MTRSVVTPAITFSGSSGSGTLGPFSLIKESTPIYFSDNAQIKVYRYSSVTDTVPDLLVEGTDYDLTGGPITGSITLTSPQTGLLTAERLHVYREQDFTQNLALGVSGAFSSGNVETRLDVITEMLQEVKREAGLSMRFSPLSVDALPKAYPLDAVIDKIVYISGTASAPVYATIDNPANLLSNITLAAENIININLVGTDLGSADTIGIVATDLAGDDSIGTVAANIAAVVTTAASIDAGDIATFAAGLDAKATVGTYAELQAISLAAAATLSAFIMTDRGAGQFQWQTGDQSANVTADPGQGVWVAPTADATGASGAWKRTFSGSANLLWWGAVGDASTDDTTVVQYAFDWMEAASDAATDTRSLFVPLGKYKLTSTITMTQGFILYGEGVTMFQDRPFSTDVEEAGSWFYIAHTGKGFTFGSQGATAVRGGAVFRDVGTYRDQPTPAASWAPTAHDYDLYIDDGNVDIENVGMLNPTKGIGIDGVSGRCHITNIRMDAFDVGIDVIRASDVCRIDGVHCWPFWYDDNIDSVTYIREYKRANLNVIKLARIDNPSIDNIFGIYQRCLVFFVQTADGCASRVQASNWGSDSCARLFEIDATVTTGIHLDLVNAYCFGYAALAGTHGILITGDNSSINLVNVRLERLDRSGIRVQTGSGNYVRMNNVLVDDWNNSGGGWAAIGCDAVGNTIEVIGQPVLTNGNSGPNYSATGTLIIPDKKGYSASVTSNVSGDLVVTHGLGITPQVIFAEVYNNANIACRTYARTSTTFTLRLYDADAGTALASTAVNLMWSAAY